MPEPTQSPNSQIPYHLIPNQFELHPHTGEIRTKVLVYEQGGVIKHVEAPAINKVELLDLSKNGPRDDVE